MYSRIIDINGRAFCPRSASDLAKAPAVENGPERCLLEILGESAAMKSVRKQIRTVAPVDSTVLIQGETGTGKELLAQAIHKLSRRKDAPLVTLNCAAIPAALLESELFGHEKGAFTGAIARRPGRFEVADGGTLFLDEIGDMARDLQAKLLRVLEDQSFERLGSSCTTRVNVRLVAATNRDLSAMVRARDFRADLYYRLNVFPIFLPPLRERRDDIPELVHHFLTKVACRMGKRVDQIPVESLRAMTAYDWPGNIRQLQNFIERCVIESEDRVFEVPLSELRMFETSTSERTGSTLEDATRSHIIKTLRAANWVVGGPNGAAARLGMARTTLIFRMRRLGIEPARRGVPSALDSDRVR